MKSLKERYEIITIDKHKLRNGLRRILGSLGFSPIFYCYTVTVKLASGEIRRFKYHFSWIYLEKYSTAADFLNNMKKAIDYYLDHPKEFLIE